MITQNFLTELELSLLRAYAQATRKSTNNPSSSATNFLGTIKTQDEFLRNFMLAFQEKAPILESEIKKGGHKDSALMLGKIQREIETKIRTILLQRGNKIDAAAFQRIVRDLKADIRSVFYDNYLNKRF